LALFPLGDVTEYSKDRDEFVFGLVVPRPADTPNPSFVPRCCDDPEFQVVWLSLLREPTKRVFDGRTVLRVEEL
jgi:hypothetical protein